MSSWFVLSDRKWQRLPMGLFDGTPLEQPVRCPCCGQNVKECSCAPLDPAVEPEMTVEPSRQRLTVALEKRRRGKLMTLVTGFQGSPTHRADLLTELKNSCGAGGTVAGPSLEIQGDQQARVRALLEGKGYRVR